MKTFRNKGRLIDHLPSVRGKYVEKVVLSHLTWFRVGGPAEVLFKPQDEKDLIYFLRNCPKKTPVTVLGLGANLLIRDGGVSGVVIRLGRGFSNIQIDGRALKVGAGTANVKLALECERLGISGLEFLRSIPGTVGGGLRMNAGAYGSELKDILVSARAVDKQGILHDVAAGDLHMNYRRSGAPSDWIFVSAELIGNYSDTYTVYKRTQKIVRSRESSQPVRTRTGGSTFKNTKDAKAWELIDRAGCRGLQLSGAQVSTNHCNFLINTGNATAADIEQLGEEVRDRVYRDSGIQLEWEIQRVGQYTSDFMETLQ